MEYPKELRFKVDNIFGPEDITITLYSGLTTFVGANGSGKTQTLKALRDYLKRQVGQDKVRYLSSNRIGSMEQYRSKVDQYRYFPKQSRGSLAQQNIRIKARST